jgi:hypothetical protein
MSGPGVLLIWKQFQVLKLQQILFVNLLVDFIFSTILI